MPQDTAPATLRRVAFYLFFDPEGRVDEYVTHGLRELHKHVDHVFVVSNSPLDDQALAALRSVADTVWVRPNVGYDVWAYKEALQRFGRTRLAEYDELLLLNYTFFGPIGGFEDLFARSEDWNVDFWGITDHAPVGDNPDTGALPAHIQSHWIAVRRAMFTSADFEQYWSRMPMISSYHDSIRHHEGRFTDHFHRLGFRSKVAYSHQDYPDDHPVFDNAVLLIRDGCPILKRRLFFHDPLYLDRSAIIGADIMDAVREAGYPEELIWRNVARTSTPRVLAANFSLYDIVPDVRVGDTAVDALKVLVVIHAFYVDAIEELLDRAALLPDGYTVLVTTDTEQKKGQLEERISRRGLSDFEVRVVESNRGRDVSAFLITCGDAITDPRYDLVVKLHSKRSVQDKFLVADWFKRHLLDNLLHTRESTANTLAKFVEQPWLGMVFPPVIAIGYPTIGNAWFGNKEEAQALCRRLGLTVPFDDSTPLAPLGSMFIARPAVLAPLVQAGFRFDDFPGEGGYGDGALSHVIERIYGYTSLSLGYLVRSVMTPRMAEVTFGFLEYRLQDFSGPLPGDILEQRTHILTASQREQTLLYTLKRDVNRRLPRLARFAQPPFRASRAAYRKLRRR